MDIDAGLYRQVALALTRMEVHRWRYEGTCKLSLLNNVLQCEHCDFSDLTAEACLSLVRLKKGLK